jgi:hypothetical protein
LLFHAVAIICVQALTAAKFGAGDVAGSTIYLISHASFVLNTARAVKSLGVTLTLVVGGSMSGATRVAYGLLLTVICQLPAESFAT